ncbi:MAG: NADH-quinone oxidoreductase subunit NuoH, partial [Desulfuromonadaceae bacterium]
AGYANHPQRPRTPLLAGQEKDWPDLLAELAARVAQTVASHGADSVALLGSPRASLEANFLLRQWAQQLGTEQLAFDPHPRRDRGARVTTARLGDNGRSLAEVQTSDLIILVGADPLAEGPLLALSLRQAVRQGARVLVLDPRPLQLPCAFDQLPLPAAKLELALQALAGGNDAAFSEEEAAFLEGARSLLEQAQRPILIGAVDLLGERGIADLLDSAAALQRPERPCGALLLLGGPNSFGGALLAADGPDYDQLLDRIQEGRIRALICLESDPCGEHPDPGRATEALSHLDTLVVLDHLPTATVRRADLFLPTAAVTEQDGSFVNSEGRLQAFERVIRPGLPIQVTGNGNHPPRTFTTATPGGLPRPAWEILAELLGLAPSLTELREQLVASDSRFTGLTALSAGGEGRRITGKGALPPAGAAPFPHCQPGQTLPLLVVTSLFGSEVLAGFSAALDAVRPEPFFHGAGRRHRSPDATYGPEQFYSRQSALLHPGKGDGDMNDLLVTGILILVKLGLIFAVVLTLAAYLVLAERKILGRMQLRYGPNRVGFFGLMQPLADVIKLLSKEDFIPAAADKALFFIAPGIAAVTALLTFAVVPFAPPLQLFGRDIPMVVCDLNVGLLYFLGLSSLAVYGIILGSWASNSKYALLGGIRALAQLISYELSMGLSLVPVVLLARSFSLTDIDNAQAVVPFALKNPPAFLIFLVSVFAESKRVPFDLPEAENEIVAGFHTEYSGMRFGLFFVGEYINMIILSSMVTVFFLGGWHGPWLPPIVWFMAKVLLVAFLFIWSRGTLPRLRYDQLMHFGWKVLVPLALANIIVSGGLLLWIHG